MAPVDDKKKQLAYVDKISKDVGKEINLYQEVQDMILKKVKINENIWNSSMEIHLPAGEQYVRKALRFSMSSPFRYSGNESESSIAEMYKTASDFGLKTLISN